MGLVQIIQHDVEGECGVHGQVGGVPEYRKLFVVKIDIVSCLYIFSDGDIEDDAEMQYGGDGEEHENHVYPAVGQVASLLGEQEQRGGKKPQITVESSHCAAFVVGEEESVDDQQIHGEEDENGQWGCILADGVPFFFPVPFPNPVDELDAGDGQHDPCGERQCRGGSQ